MPTSDDRCSCKQSPVVRLVGLRPRLRTPVAEAWVRPAVTGTEGPSAESVPAVVGARSVVEVAR